MSYTDDPIRDYDNYCREQEREEARLPVCDGCGETIYDEYCYNINGDILCEECMTNEFRRCTEDLISEGD
jgi:formylmethanofuran dehydrogenase subunit E